MVDRAKMLLLYSLYKETVFNVQQSSVLNFNKYLKEECKGWGHGRVSHSKEKSLKLTLNPSAWVWVIQKINYGTVEKFIKIN